MRCDGVKPVCGQCIHMEREYDCEYTDGPNLSPTQVLERNISQLEARIRQIEAAPPTASTSARPSRLSGASGGSESQSSPIRERESASISDPSDIAVPSNRALDPHPAVIRLLVSIFVPLASQLGFFLNVPRFLDAVYMADAALRRSRLSPCLLDAALLWGSRLSTNASIRAYETKLLARAVQSISDALPQVASLQHNAVHIIQAEVLLSNYFFCQNRYLEGTYHCSAAVALAMSCKVNRIRSSTADVESADTARPTSFNLPPPVDAVEEGERICAFWSVYTLDRSWSVAQGAVANDVFGGVQVDTPWPVEMSVYEERGLPADFRGSNTLFMFFNDPSPQFSGDGLSSLALRAKSAALFEQATRLASQWSPTMHNFDAFYLDVLRLDNLIRHFIETLLPLNSLEAPVAPETAMDLLVTHTYAHAAAIRLHTRFEIADSILDRRDLSAARAAVAVLDCVNLADLSFLDPIMAMLWTVVGQALIESITQLGGDAFVDQRQALVHSLVRILNALRKFTDVCPLMTSQASILNGEMQNRGIL